MSHQLETFIVSGTDTEAGSWVLLPISKEDFLEVAATIGARNPTTDSVALTIVEPESEVLTPHLKEPFDLNELNYLAAKLEQLGTMGEEQRNVFHACLQAGRHCDGTPQLINLLENLDRFDLQPALSPEDYGAFLINLYRDEYADQMNALEQSVDPKEQAFFTYLAEIESHIDLAAYGKAQAENEGGEFTDYGLLTEQPGFAEQYRGAQDIPAEYRVSEFQPHEPLLRLENTDLTDVLTKMHEVSGYIDDLGRNLEILHRRRSADFLLLLTEDKAVLSEAMHVYRAGTPSHDAFVNATDAKMFSIYVTDFQTDFIGDIREVDAAAHRADILANSIHFADVKAVTMESESVTFTPEEWKNVSMEERDSFQSWVRQFADGDYTKVNRHIESQHYTDDFWAKPATMEEFYSKLAQDVPAKTERTPEEKPKSVLERIAAARVDRTAEPPKPEAPKHRTEPER